MDGKFGIRVNDGLYHCVAAAGLHKMPLTLSVMKARDSYA